VETTDLEEVPLTDEEKSDIAEAWLAYLHALPPDRVPDMTTSEGSGQFKATLNRILAAHDFEPFTGTFRWDSLGRLVVMARRLPAARPSV
jgi:hypothetical protein